MDNYPEYKNIKFKTSDTMDYHKITPYMIQLLNYVNDKKQQLTIDSGVIKKIIDISFKSMNISEIYKKLYKYITSAIKKLSIKIDEVNNQTNKQKNQLYYNLKEINNKCKKINDRIQSDQNKNQNIVVRISNILDAIKIYFYLKKILYKNDMYTNETYKNITEIFLNLKIFLEEFFNLNKIIIDFKMLLSTQPDDKPNIPYHKMKDANEITNSFIDNTNTNNIKDILQNMNYELSEKLLTLCKNESDYNNDKKFNNDTIDVNISVTRNGKYIEFTRSVDTYFYKNINNNKKNCRLLYISIHKFKPTHSNTMHFKVNTQGCNNFEINNYIDKVYNPKGKSIIYDYRYNDEIKYNTFSNCQHRESYDVRSNDMSIEPSNPEIIKTKLPDITVKKLYPDEKTSLQREYNKLSEIISYSMKQISLLFTIYNRQKYLRDFNDVDRNNIIKDIFKINNSDLTEDNFNILHKCLNILEHNYNYIVSFYYDVKEFKNTLPNINFKVEEQNKKIVKNMNEFNMYLINKINKIDTVKRKNENTISNDTNKRTKRKKYLKYKLKYLKLRKTIKNTKI